MEEQLNRLSLSDDSRNGPEQAALLPSSLASIWSTAVLENSTQSFTFPSTTSPIQPLNAMAFNQPNLNPNQQPSQLQPPLVMNPSLAAYVDSHPGAFQAAVSNDVASTNLLASSGTPLQQQQYYRHMQQSYDNAYVAPYPPGQAPVNFMPGLLQSRAQPLPGIALAPPPLPPFPSTFGAFNFGLQAPCTTPSQVTFQLPQQQQQQLPAKIPQRPAGNLKITQQMTSQMPMHASPLISGGGPPVFGQVAPFPSGSGVKEKKRKKLTPVQEQRLRDDATRERIESNFRSFLQNPKLNASWLLRSPQEARFLSDLICPFMNYLARRLADPEVTYLDLADKRHDDFAFYDDRLMEAINQLQLPPVTVDKYERILDQYRALHPPSVWKFRVKLMTIREACIEMKELPQQTRSQLDYRMVTYKHVNSQTLYKNILKRTNSVEQLQFFIKEIGLSKEGSANLDRFVSTLRTALETSPLAQIGVKVHPFGSLSNGLGTYDSDLDIVVQFKKIISADDRLDFETCMLILKIIRIILPKKLDFCRRLPKNCIVPSKRCPIIKLDFEECCPDLRQYVRNGGGGGARGDKTQPQQQQYRQLCFNKCDISVTSVYGMYNSKVLKFFTSYDRRFYEMSLLLKFWAKHNAMINTEGFSSYAFVMCIIYFLQTVEPSILPPIELLQQLARKNATKYPPIQVHQWNFEFCDDEQVVRQAHGAAVNEMTTPELIVEFFRFYQTFDYGRYAISTRRGVPTTKEALYKEKEQQGLEYAFKRTLVVIEDPFVLEHNPGSIFHHHYMPKWRRTLDNLLENCAITKTNVIKVLTNPAQWDTKLPPRDGGRDSKESKDLKKLLKKVQEQLAQAAVEEARKRAEVVAAAVAAKIKQAEERSKSDLDSVESTTAKSSDAAEADPVATWTTELVPTKPSPIDYKMVTYRTVDHRSLHEAIKLATGQEQISQLIATIRLTDDCRDDMYRFVALFTKVLQATVPLKPLAPRCTVIGSLTSGLALYNADINLVVHLDSKETPLQLLTEFTHSKTVLKILQSILAHGLGFERRQLKREKGSVPSRKRPILPVYFSNSIKGMVNKEPAKRKFNRGDISVGLLYGEVQSELLQLLGTIDGRFTQLVFVLKYWAKQNGFINQDLYKQNYSFSSYAFTLLVVFFCQTTSPPILPKISQLMAEANGKQSRQWLGKYMLELKTSFGPMEPKNSCTVQELVVQWFEYYANFDYEQSAICPRLGEAVSKKTLYLEKSSQVRHFKKTAIVIEDPLIHELNVCDNQERRKWVDALSKFAADHQLTADNCLAVLTNPDLFGIGFGAKTAASAAGDAKKTETTSTTPVVAVASAAAAKTTSDKDGGGGSSASENGNTTEEEEEDASDGEQQKTEKDD